MGENKDSELVSNRRARHEYEILDTYEAGIALLGTEIKSLRDHGGSLQDAYVSIERSEAYLKQASIAPYKFASAFNHEEKGDRKLLLHKKEIIRLKKEIEQKGFTVIPLAMVLRKGRVKVIIAVAKGKKLYDKREAVKKREQKRSIEREMKN